MSLLLFPDVNLWVALNFEKHAHHAAAKLWYETVSSNAKIVFCRQTQLGLFRILTTTAVMGPEVISQQQCWSIYDDWISTGQAVLTDEPSDLEVRLRALTTGATSSPKAWMDAYLAAFPEAANLTLVTFDRALAGKAKGALRLV